MFGDMTVGVSDDAALPPSTEGMEDPATRRHIRNIASPAGRVPKVRRHPGE